MAPAKRVGLIFWLVIVADCWNIKLFVDVLLVGTDGIRILGTNCGGLVVNKLVEKLFGVEVGKVAGNKGIVAGWIEIGSISRLAGNREGSTIWPFVRTFLIK